MFCFWLWIQKPSKLIQQWIMKIHSITCCKEYHNLPRRKDTKLLPTFQMQQLPSLEFGSIHWANTSSDYLLWGISLKQMFQNRKKHNQSRTTGYCKENWSRNYANHQRVLNKNLIMLWYLLYISAPTEQEVYIPHPKSLASYKIFLIHHPCYIQLLPNIHGIAWLAFFCHQGQS